jgi:broad specificity phosphatase PhoE
MAAATDSMVDIRRAMLATLAALARQGHSPGAILAVCHAQTLALVMEEFGPDAAMHLCQRAAERIAEIAQETR